MPYCKPAHLPYMYHRDLDFLAQQWRPMKESAVAMVCHTALHEAAHLVADVHCKSWVFQVTITPPHHVSRTGEHGSLESAQRNSSDYVFGSLVGYAWEERHGDVENAQCDLKWAQERAALEDLDFDAILHESRWFVAMSSMEELIRIVAAGLLGVAPKSGVIRGCTLEGVVKWIRPAVPEGGRGGPAWRKWCSGLPATVPPVPA